MACSEEGFAPAENLLATRAPEFRFGIFLPGKGQEFDSWGPARFDSWEPPCVAGTDLHPTKPIDNESTHVCHSDRFESRACERKICSFGP